MGSRELKSYCALTERDDGKLLKFAMADLNSAPALTTAF